jgi:hypothetical protein
MDQVASLLNRPKLYNNIDGVGELGMGFMMLGFGLLMWLQFHAPKGSVWHGMWAFAIYMAVLLSILHYGPKAIKTRYTYPRTGFVEYRKRDMAWSAIVAFVISAAVGAGLGMAVRRHWHWDVSALGSLFGLAIAAIYAYRIARAVPWKLVVACVLALGSLATAFLPSNLLASVAMDSWATHPVRTKLEATYLLSVLLCGALFLISGAISFRLYLRHTEAPAQDTQ